jgi:TolA-binding protein
MRSRLAILALALLAPLSLHAQPLIQSQEGIALENQILQLQQQVQQLQANSGGGGSALGGSGAPAPSGGAPAPDPSIVTNLLNQVGQLQTQIQQLNGEVDTLQNQVNTQHAQTEKEIGDLNFKLSNGATPGTPARLVPPAAAIPTPPPATVAAGAVPAGTPKEILHAGLLAYEKGDYATAEAAARRILANANTSPQGYRAQYLLAQSLAAEDKPQDAAIAYDDAYNRDREGSEAPESLLGLASSLTNINQDEAACDTIASLNSQFPTPPAGMAARIVAASHRAHCS